MATTANYGWTTPDDTGYVKDGALAIRTLGNAIDTTVDSIDDRVDILEANDIPKTLIDAKGDLLAGTASDTIARLAVGANGTVLTADSSEPTGLKWAAAAGATFGLFHKADVASVAFTRTGNGTAEVKAGTYIDVNGTLVTLATATSITMPTLTAGTDYFIYVSNTGSVQAVAATGTWPTPVGSPPANSRLIGGFHYAPGSNATAQSGGNTTPQINEFSFWDLKWRPAAPDPRGMTLVAGRFWSDIYLLNRDPQTNGTSRNNFAIANGETGGTTTPIIPTAFGGNGTNRYPIMSWWNTSECLGAFGKRLPTYGEFAQLAYGVTEDTSRGSDPVTSGLNTSNAGTDQRFTSRWGVIQASGVMWVWGHDFGGGAAAASWADTNGDRGQVFQQANAAFFGGAWGDSALSGSRSSNWSTAPSFSFSGLGGRGVCDHLFLV